jgi:hypothetical protein
LGFRPIERKAWQGVVQPPRAQLRTSDSRMALQTQTTMGTP